MPNHPANPRFYHYQALEHADSIRLLELFPGDPEDQSRIRLFQVRRSQDYDYEALSYTWGEASLIDNALEAGSECRIRITRNLKDALVDLRPIYASRTLWVDAICIDQFNAQERRHQVALMGSIFKGAECVVVWLGN